MIAALRRLHEEASPGPWIVHCDEGERLAWVKVEGRYHPAWRPSDAALIVALRNALPALLDVVEALAAFRSGGDWGMRKAWLVEGAVACGHGRERGIEAARQITRWQAKVDTALARLEGENP